jgi:DNA polymerase-1
MITTALIDADIVAYKFGCTGMISWGDIVSYTSTLEDTIKEFEGWLSGILMKCGVTQYHLCLSSDTNFRYRILPTYKHNRADKSTPPRVNELKDHMRSKHPILTMNRLEADDVMGIMSTSRPGECVIVSTDKDLRQIPGWLFNWDKMETPTLIDPSESEAWFWTQVLTGDTTDGYKGCPKIGPKRAKVIVEGLVGSPKDKWALILEAYAKEGLTEADALQQAQVAYILQCTDYKNKRIKPWTPQTGGKAWT